MAVIGNPRGFHKKFKFIVEIDDIGHASFQKCSEFSMEVANVQYFEGDSLIPNKSPGRLTSADASKEAPPRTGTCSTGSRTWRSPRAASA